MLGLSFLELDSKPGLRSFPVTQRHRPFLTDVCQIQIEQFQQHIVTRELSPVLGDFGQAHVH